MEAELTEQQGRKRYRRIAICIACLCLLASCLPYLAGWAASSDRMQFGGVLAHDRADVYTYLSAMHQGAHGNWSYHILHTPEEHHGEPLKLFYLILGKLAHAFGLPMAVAYQLARIAAGTCLIAAIYTFTGYFVKDRRSHLVAYLLACVGGGLGWLIPFLKAAGCQWADWVPIEFWLFEGFTFPTILFFVHGALATAIMLITFLAILKYQRTTARREMATVILLTIALAIVQPLCLPILATTVCTYMLLLTWRRWTESRQWPTREEIVITLIVGAISLALAAYFLLPFLINPVFRSWKTRSLTLSPPPLHYLWGYGLIVPLAIIGARRTLREKHETGLFLIAWLLAAAVLIYLPYLPQRRFAQGIIVPLACLAALGIERLCWKAEKGVIAFICRLLLYLVVICNVIIVTQQTTICLSQTQLVFCSREELEAMAWLESNSAPNDTVLAGLRTGAFIPAAIGHRVFWGHWCETIHLEEKGREFRDFFERGTSDEWRCYFLQRYGIRYLFYGPQEKASGDFDPSQAPYLTKQFQTGAYAVYEVAPQGADVE